MSTQSVPCYDSHSVQPECCGYLQLTAHSPPPPHTTVKATRCGDAEGQATTFTSAQDICVLLCIPEMSQNQALAKIVAENTLLDPWAFSSSAIGLSVAEESTGKSTHHVTVSGSARHASSTSVSVMHEQCMYIQFVVLFLLFENCETLG